MKQAPGLSQKTDTPDRSDLYGEDTSTSGLLSPCSRSTETVVCVSVCMFVCGVCACV